LINFLESDRKDFITFLDSRFPNTSNETNLEKFTLDELNYSECSFKTPSFLLELCKTIFKMKLENPHAKWPRLELTMTETIHFEKTNLKTASEEFKALALGGIKEFEGESVENFKIKDQFLGKTIFQLPLIFLDEFSIGNNAGDYEKCRFAFYRNMIRACGLIPVLLGTNSKITNLVTAAEASGKDSKLWAYVFNKLPPYPRRLLKDQLKAFIPAETDLFEWIYQILKNERPLFIESVFGA